MPPSPRVRTRALALAALLAVEACDTALTRPGLSLAAQGVIDETAHLSTTALMLLSLGLQGRDRIFLGTALAASVLVDSDHIPGAIFGNQILTAGTGRPYTHSLVTPVVLLAASRLRRAPRWRTAALAAGFGVCAHLVRDLATGPGIPLLWPFSNQSIRVPYLPYTVILATMCVAAISRPRGTAAAAGAPRRPV